MTTASCPGVGDEVTLLARQVPGRRGLGLRAQRAQRGLDVAHGIPGQGAAGRGTLAGEIELVAHRGRVRRVPGVFAAAERIGAIQHQRSQSLPMPDCEHLREESAVGVAVEVNLADAERIEHGGKIIRRQCRAVERRGRAQPHTAGRNAGLGQNCSRCSVGQSTAADLPVPRLSMITTSRWPRSGPYSAR